MQPMVDSELLGGDFGHELMRSIRNSDLHGLEISLKKLPEDIDITTITDMIVSRKSNVYANENSPTTQGNGYTLLHLAIFKDNDDSVHML
jgi:hypothetical protein